MTAIRRRVRGGGVDDTPIPPGREPVKLGAVLRRMREKGELPGANNE